MVMVVVVVVTANVNLVSLLFSLSTQRRTTFFTVFLANSHPLLVPEDKTKFFSPFFQSTVIFRRLNYNKSKSITKKKKKKQKQKKF